jgi:hypothetical protein
MPGLENTSWTITFAKTSRIGRIPQKKKQLLSFPILQNPEAPKATTS